MHNSIAERCFSYIINHPLAHFPGIHDWASKSKRRPWLWRWRKPKGAITNILSEIRWRQKKHIRFNTKLRPFWALVIALKYLPYLFNKATRSEELIALMDMWPYRYPLLVSLIPHDTKKAGKQLNTTLPVLMERSSARALRWALLPTWALDSNRVQLGRDLATSAKERLPRGQGSFVVCGNFEIPKYRRTVQKCR